MSRLTLEIRYKKHPNGIWRYKLKAWKAFKSSGSKSKKDAIQKAEEALKAESNPKMAEMPFIDYAEPFFQKDRCPHASRLSEEGRPVTEGYLEIQLINMKTHILPSRLKMLKMGEITRGHIVDFRSDLSKKGLKPPTINKIMSALKVIFMEAKYREHILSNPTEKIGNVKESHNERILTNEELSKLFPIEPEKYMAIWKEESAYVGFSIAYLAGMRRSEVLALQWKNVDLEKNIISIENAWKNPKTLGKPKSGKTRTMPISSGLAVLLKTYKEKVETDRPDNFVICNADGTRLGNTWWKKRFSYGLEKAKITLDGGRIVPHRLRHTLGTHLLMIGIGEEVVHASMGWSSRKASNRYSHPQPEHLLPIANAIDSMYPNVAETDSLEAFDAQI